MMLSVSTLPSWKGMKLERNDHDGGSRLLPLSGVIEHTIHGVHSGIPFCTSLFLNGGSCRLERPKSFAASRLVAYVFMGLDWVRS
jgi:hypothetical protein